MELSTSIHEDSRYISTAENNLKRVSYLTEKPRKRGSEVVEDHRQDVPNEPERRPWTVNIASTMNTLFCQAPCFVNTIGSMVDGGVSPDNRMEAPASPARDDDDMALSGSSLHASPSPPIRFPSIHLASDDWDSGLNDSAFLDISDDGVPINTHGRISQHQSIYRTPSNLSEAFSKVSQGRSSSRTVNHGGASVASTIATSTMGKYGLYRCPAWSDDADDDDTDSDVISIAGDEDWHDIAPASSYSNSQAYRNPEYNDSKTIIDVTHMEDLFNDFSVSGTTYRR